MRAFKIIGLLIFIVAFALFTRNNAHAIGRRAHPLLAVFQSPASGSLLQVLAPKQGQKIADNAVTVRYALQANATAQSIPTFQLRLDSNDVIQTGDTTYTFTGLQPGIHTLSIQAVDANGAPIANTQSQIQFTVLQTRGALSNEIEGLEASTLPSDPDGSSLSVLGVVGFGVLLGGALSLYRSRSELQQTRSTDLKQ